MYCKNEKEEWEYGDEWGYEEDWEYGEDWDFEDDQYFKYVEDEDVIAAGTACNELGHFNISQLEMKERASRVLEKHGYSAAQIRQDSYRRKSSSSELSSLSSVRGRHPVPAPSHD